LFLKAISDASGSDVSGGAAESDAVVKLHIS